MIYKEAMHLLMLTELYSLPLDTDQVTMILTVRKQAYQRGHVSFTELPYTQCLP